MITTTKDLKSLVTRLKKAEFVTVDTEFIRERTYWARLCLIQVSGKDNEAFAIDPLAEGMDLSPFYDLMQDKNVMKVFHACRQDLEIFYKETGKLPTPIFDTQVAAMVCGFGDQVSYENIVNALTGKKLDKSARFTDWALRPLSVKQIKYALADVIHLRKVYEKLSDHLDTLKRKTWIRDEMKSLTDRENYTWRPEEAWERIRVPNNKPRTLGILQEVAAWRERMAQELDVPRGRILKDEALAEIAAHPPTSKETMSRLRGLHQGFAESERGKSLLEAVKIGLSLDEKDCPRREPRTHFPPGLGPTIDLLRVLLKLKCEEGKVAQKLLCSASDLELIAAYGEKADVPALSGWRHKLFGKEALELRDGRLAICVENGHLKMVKAD